jgi:hypothetical protein
MKTGATMKSTRYSKFDPRTQHGPLWVSRLRLVLQQEPGLEPWVIAERFGIDEIQAQQVRWHVRRGDRRIL